MDIRIDYPEIFAPLWGAARYKGAYGGRGSGKSHFFATYCVIQLLKGRNVLCVREIQSSIADSVKRLMEQKIEEMGVSVAFKILEKEIRCITSGAIAIFKGMQSYNAATVKSLEGFDVAWWEEAQVASHRSLEMLTPTIRRPGSELLFSWNPENPDDPVDVLLRKHMPEGAIVLEANWDSNPWFPDELRQDMERDKKRDPDKWSHVWQGEYRGLSEARVFRNWRIDELTPPENVVWFYGADWGFAKDATAGLRCCVIEKTTLYIDAEVYEVGVPNEKLPTLFDGLPAARDWPIIADSARPETIDYVRRHGFPKMRAAKKGKGSVEDGIMFLQGMDIVVHPLCANTIHEFRNYAYKTDKHTGEILPVVEDANNHCIDALRYAVEGMHRKGKMLPTMLDVPRRRDRYERHEDDDATSWKTV